MTGNEMLTALQFRLEDDTSNNNFSQAQKLGAINQATRTITTLVNVKMLLDLVTHTDSGTLGTEAVTGYKTMDLASFSLIRGIDGIFKIYDDTNNVWATIVQPIDFNFDSASSKYGTMATVMDNKLYITPSSCTNVDIWHLRGVADIPASSDEITQLDPLLHHIVVDLAESELWRADNRSERANAPYQNAMTKINQINQGF